jgi:hypothetical protein
VGGPQGALSSGGVDALPDLNVLYTSWQNLERELRRKAPDLQHSAPH